MFVTKVNDVKIYNLSVGKTVPEWVSDHRKRNNLMKKVDSRRQIELIQDFEMPSLATSIRMSPDQQYILATGTYKPRLKCFEVSNLSAKFERCFDSEATTFEIISDDYSKIAILQSDRFIELHSGSGRHYRLRIPRFGRDMKYHKPSSDLFVVGNSNEIYRLNLERGTFLQSLETDKSCLNACDINPEHGLLAVGSKEGVIEAWDPRTKLRCATLDISLNLADYKNFPSITSISFKNGLQMGIGTASGHVLLYDIRSHNPLLIKNHLNGIPIKRIAFNSNQQIVYSLDEVMLKLWDEQTGKQVAYIESTTKFNDFCTIPATGVLFFAQEHSKMLTYYIPAMGPAPRWCSFLDNMIEEIESEDVEVMFDDYQFVTSKELEQLGLSNLVGSNLLKSYMHGYYLDIRLYNKAKAISEPFEFNKMRKANVREIATACHPRLQVKADMPQVNQEFAMKLMQEKQQLGGGNRTNTAKISLLEDSRFKAMFEQSDFAIQKNADEFKLLAPVINRLNKSTIKNENLQNRTDKNILDTPQRVEDISSVEESSEDENIKEYAKEMKLAYKEIRRREEEKEKTSSESEMRRGNEKVPRDLLDSHQSNNIHSISMGGKSRSTVSLHGERQTNVANLSFRNRMQNLENVGTNVEKLGDIGGNHKIMFECGKSNIRSVRKSDYQINKHREERKRLLRPVKSLNQRRRRN